MRGSPCACGCCIAGVAPPGRFPLARPSFAHPWVCNRVYHTCASARQRRLREIWWIPERRYLFLILVCYHRHRGHRGHRDDKRERAAAAPVAPVLADCWFAGKLVGTRFCASATHPAGTFGNIPVGVDCGAGARCGTSVGTSRRHALCHYLVGNNRSSP